MSLAIELNALSKIYSRSNGTSFKAVDNLTLEVPAGQVIGLLGPNGAGKTTTIKMICDIISPTHGSVKLNGYAIKEQRALALRHIGAVLEGTRNIYWQLTPLQNLTYFGRLKGVQSKELPLFIPRTCLRHSTLLIKKISLSVSFLAAHNRRLLSPVLL